MLKFSIFDIDPFIYNIKKYHIKNTTESEKMDLPCILFFIRRSYVEIFCITDSNR